MSLTSQSEPSARKIAFPAIAPGDRIRVTQRIVGYNRTWLTRVEGEVLSAQPEKTASWFAHGKDDKLWLLRIRLRKQDGEVTLLNIDQNAQIELLTGRS